MKNSLKNCAMVWLCGLLTISTGHAQISPELQERDYALYALWINSLPEAKQGTRIYILSQTKFIDPLKVPCERMSLPDPDSSDGAIWLPLQQETNKDVAIDPARLSAYIDPKVSYEITSTPKGELPRKTIQFTRISFRDERSEAGFVYIAQTNEDRAYRGQLVFARKTGKLWKFASPCDFIIKDNILMRAVTH